jgi:Ca2+-binding EF-hand superfamily protein
MNMKRTMMLASAFVLLAGARLGWSQQFQPPSFDQLDKDKNGSLSKQEVTDFFAQLAGRGNGNAQGGGPNVDQIFARWDANGDGNVSKEEFDNRPRRQRNGGQGN